MMTVKLSPRLLAAAEFVRCDKSVCDVGTDHALLPCYLYQQGARSITASDINDGPLDAARETIE
ncbi:MAG: tRNA (adenine(22)-N(1))-methyltransferase TrmK, partial [Ruminiclostridium sp.]|nr:tRNA (adenine(22)-N(1))-methyltransferase TrmK [Ruminiclostridium sp.]